MTQITSACTGHLQVVGGSGPVVVAVDLLWDETAPLSVTLEATDAKGCLVELQAPRDLLLDALAVEPAAWVGARTLGACRVRATVVVQWATAHLYLRLGVPLEAVRFVLEESSHLVAPGSPEEAALIDAEAAWFLNDILEGEA